MRRVEHYEELGVPPSASTAEIRSSYLALARRYHPDRLVGSTPLEREQAAGRMARINAAWSVLSDQGRRARYDQLWRDATPSGAHVRDAGRTWQAFDDGDDPVDPRLLDDTPTGAPTIRRGLAFVPVVLSAAGAGSLILGLVVGLGPLLGAGVLLLAAAALSFLVLPLIALANSSRADRDH